MENLIGLWKISWNHGKSHGIMENLMESLQISWDHGKSLRYSRILDYQGQNTSKQDVGITKSL
jgi:hypothetical protein